MLLRWTIRSIPVVFPGANRFCAPATIVRPSPVTQLTTKSMPLRARARLAGSVASHALTSTPSSRAWASRAGRTAATGRAQSVRHKAATTRLPTKPLAPRTRTCFIRREARGPEWRRRRPRAAAEQGGYDGLSAQRPVGHARCSADPAFVTGASSVQCSTAVDLAFSGENSTLAMHPGWVNDPSAARFHPVGRRRDRNPRPPEGRGPDGEKARIGRLGGRGPRPSGR